MVNRVMVKNIHMCDLIFQLDLYLRYQNWICERYQNWIFYERYGRTGIDFADKMIRDSYRLRSINDRTKRASCKNVSKLTRSMF